jgi:hypothetical protein
MTGILIKTWSDAKRHRAEERSPQLTAATHLAEDPPITQPAVD